MTYIYYTYIIYRMKYLYLSSQRSEFCIPQEGIINNFTYCGMNFYYTKLTDNKTVQSQFILNSYNFKNLLVHIRHDEIPLFLTWRQTHYPEGIQTIVNIYDSKDRDTSRYMLNIDTDLTTICHFFKTFEHVLMSIASVAH